MMRTKYGYNSQWINFGKIVEVLPIFMCDVVPGETVGGTLSARVRSGAVARQVDTRTYLDVFAFYVPFRLVWSGWIDFITKGVGTVPTAVFNVAYPRAGRWTLIPKNVIPGTTVGAATAISKLPLDAYYLVWNKFFKENGAADAVTPSDTNGVDPLLAMQRPSKLGTSSLSTVQATQDTSVTVPVTGISGSTGTGSLSLQDLRSGFAKDQWAKVRAFYGDKYVDYLAAIGVQTNWAVLEEPELLLQHHADWRFVSAKATVTGTVGTANTPNYLGQVSGYFDSTVKLNFKRQFFAEHGVVIAMVVARADPLYTYAWGGPTMYAKYLPEDFWTPERSNFRRYGITRSFFTSGTPQGTNAQPAGQDSSFQYPAWEEYRQGLDCQTVGLALSDGAFGLVNSRTQPTTPAGVKQQVPTDYTNSFTQPLGSSTSEYHYQVTTDVRLTRHSPVPRADKIALR